jgi:hypothetical protein
MIGGLSLTAPDKNKLAQILQRRHYEQIKFLQVSGVAILLTLRIQSLLLRYAMYSVVDNARLGKNGLPSSSRAKKS